MTQVDGPDSNPTTGEFTLWRLYRLYERRDQKKLGIVTGHLIDSTEENDQIVIASIGGFPGLREIHVAGYPVEAISESGDAVYLDHGRGGYGRSFV